MNNTERGVDTKRSVDTENITPDTEDRVSKSTKKVETLIKPQKTIGIEDIAYGLGKEKIKKTLPNNKVIETIDWSPDELEDVYKYVDNWKNENNLGINDLVIIDGGAPTWLLPVISHALHPVYTAVKYPQGNTFIALNGVNISENGEGENLHFNIEDKGNYTLVEFSLEKPAIDLEKTIETLIAPNIETGKPVIITGRGPIAIATSLAEAYAHLVPFVANFQPGTGAVISISHDENNPLGKIIEV